MSSIIGFIMLIPNSNALDILHDQNIDKGSQYDEDNINIVVPTQFSKTTIYLIIQT